MISVVIPTFNESASLAQLHTELDDVAQQHNYQLQIIFVDDGSTDGTWKAIEQLAAADSRVLGIRFRRNFGKAAALSAGFDAAEGEVIITMDADLQDDPKEFPLLLAKLEQGYDVVSGWKQRRYDPWHKVWPSRVFNWMVGKLTGVKLHDHNCGLKCYRRDVIHEVRLYGELHRFVPVLAASRGFKVGEVVIEHRPRVHGQSKYGWSRLPKGFLDLLTVQFITRFGQRPQHWLGTAGMISLCGGMLGMVYLATIWCTSRMFGDAPVHLHQTAALYYSLVALLIGAQLLAVGFVAEMIASLVSRESDFYSVKEHTSPEKLLSVPASPAKQSATEQDTSESERQ